MTTLLAVIGGLVVAFLISQGLMSVLEKIRTAIQSSHDNEKD